MFDAPAARAALAVMRKGSTLSRRRGSALSSPKARTERSFTSAVAEAASGTQAPVARAA
jgi:hypothetical protein